VEKDGREASVPGGETGLSLVTHLRTNLLHVHNMLTGCTRRHIWTKDDETPWYMVKGNAYLKIIATPNVVATPVGPIGVWTHDSTIVDFRGGPWRDWWVTDLHETWALTREYSGLNLRPYFYILQEDRGRLDSRKISTEDLPKVNIGEIIRRGEKEPFGRLAKNSQRAYVACKRCPVKQRCDTQDKVTPDGTADWGPGYPYP
jgi:hypothetical protein